ncbi:MAG TPA: hypothetical protein VHT91_04815 [Kofleriaceae bacterium]|nr:hypothetical protein [Kofleriaceae bacterium]
MGLELLAGDIGGHGNEDGAGAAAHFNSPSSVAVDGSGNVYVADEVNHTIRKVTAGGVVTTLAGLRGFLAAWTARAPRRASTSPLAWRSTVLATSTWPTTSTRPSAR